MLSFRGAKNTLLQFLFNIIYIFIYVSKFHKNNELKECTQVTFS